MPGVFRAAVWAVSVLGVVRASRGAPEAVAEDVNAEHLATKIAALQESISRQGERIAQMELWRARQDLVLTHLARDGAGRLKVDADLVVENHNLFVFATESTTSGEQPRGNVVVGLDHSYHTASNSFVAGRSNTISGDASVVSGGTGNVASAQYAVVCGGAGNRALAYAATVAGGAENRAMAAKAVVSGGLSNSARGMYATRCRR